MSTFSYGEAPKTERLVFSRFTQDDAPEFARVLADPEVTRSIMAKATTPEQCLVCARQRIDWHNSSWDIHGYGVWALRKKLPDGTPSDDLIGWCGLTATDHGPTPEILYGFAREYWGGGYATEAARATMDWAFGGALCDGIDAVIFGPLNPRSSSVAKNLGMVRSGTIPFDKFLPDQQLGRDVLDYEVWRLREGACLDFASLLFQASFKAGLLVSAKVANENETLATLRAAACQRPDRGEFSDADINRHVGDAFRRGIKDCQLDVFHVSRSEWPSQ